MFCYFSLFFSLSLFLSLSLSLSPSLLCLFFPNSVFKHKGLYSSGLAVKSTQRFNRMWQIFRARITISRKIISQPGLQYINIAWLTINWIGRTDAANIEQSVFISIALIAVCIFTQFFQHSENSRPLCIFRSLSLSLPLLLSECPNRKLLICTGT